MSKLTPTYVRDNGKVFAFFEGRIIAEGGDFKHVEESAVDYLEGVEKKRKQRVYDDKRNSATHITTPNGLKGEILGRTGDVWGEKELTVRFENGRFAKLTAHPGAEIEFINERTAAAPTNPIEALQTVLDDEYERDLGGLEERSAALESLVVDVSHHIAKASYEEEQILNKIAIAAEVEHQEIGEALEYLKQADAETFTTDNKFDFGVAEQGELGRAKNDSWLDHTVQEMVDETNGQNFDQILTEEPGQLVAELEIGTLADQGSTAEVALSHVTAKTAAFKGPEVESYRDQFVAATEMARRNELAVRLDKVKEASKQTEEQEENIVDEQVFI